MRIDWNRAVDPAEPLRITRNRASAAARYALDRLAVASWPWVGEPRTVTERFDLSVESFAVTADGRSVYVAAEDAGLVRLFVVSVRTGETSLAAPATRGAYANLAVAQRTRSPFVVAYWGSSVDPPEIVRFATNFMTPILLSVGEHHFRVPINNTLENWSVLQRLRVPSRLLVWPDENHWVAAGENSRHFYEQVHAWLARGAAWIGTAT